MQFKEWFTGAFQVFVNFPLFFLTDFLVSLWDFSTASTQIFSLNLGYYSLSIIRFFGRTLLAFIPFLLQIRIAFFTRFGEHCLQLICNIDILQIGSFVFFNQFGGFFQKHLTLILGVFGSNHAFLVLMILGYWLIFRCLIIGSFHHCCRHRIMLPHLPPSWLKLSHTG